MREEAAASAARTGPDWDARMALALEAETALRSTEARVETSVWGAGVGLWELDFQENWTRWFSDWCDRLDLEPCEGKQHISRWDARIHPYDVGEAMRRFWDHVAGKEDYYDA